MYNKEMEIDKEIIFITGGAGYIGAMLAHQFSQKENVLKIICLDKEDKPEFLTKIKGGDKIYWIKGNTSDTDWQERVSKFAPTIVIHTAWQIREMYGDKDKQWKWNVIGSDNVFDFAFREKSVRKLIHFSTVASYSARADNSMDTVFDEADAFRDSDYLYAIEKKITEEHLRQKFDNSRNKEKITQVIIIRPVSITGPRGRFMKVRLGLQSILSGQMKDNLLQKTLTALVSWIPLTKKWCRQFVHEDDINDVVELLAFKDIKENFEIFNICPPGPIVKGDDFAKALNKKSIIIPPIFVRIAFFLAWHLSRGRVPTSKGGWKSYSYPIVVTGSKIERKYGYKYKYESLKAFTDKVGRYAGFVS